MKTARPLSEWLTDAEEDLKFLKKLAASKDPADAAILAERGKDLANALTNSAQAIRRISSHPTARK